MKLRLYSQLSVSLVLLLWQGQQSAWGSDLCDSMLRTLGDVSVHSDVESVITDYVTMSVRLKEDTALLASSRAMLRGMLKERYLRLLELGLTEEYLASRVAAYKSQAVPAELVVKPVTQRQIPTVAELVMHPWLNERELDYSLSNGSYISRFVPRADGSVIEVRHADGMIIHHASGLSASVTDYRFSSLSADKLTYQMRGASKPHVRMTVDGDRFVNALDPALLAKRWNGAQVSLEFVDFDTASGRETVIFTTLRDPNDPLFSRSPELRRVGMVNDAGTKKPYVFLNEPAVFYGGQSPFFFNISPDGKRLLTDVRDPASKIGLNNLLLVDLVQKKKMRLVLPDSALIAHSTWSPDGRFLLLWGRKHDPESTTAIFAKELDSELHVFDMKTGLPVPVYSLEQKLLSNLGAGLYETMQISFSKESDRFLIMGSLGDGAWDEYLCEDLASSTGATQWKKVLSQLRASVDGLAVALHPGTLGSGVDYVVQTLDPMAKKTQFRGLRSRDPSATGKK